MTKLTKEQIIHYLKGGKFRAIYNPTKMDISNESKMHIGNKIEVWQNIIHSPIVSIKEVEGQHAFNANEIGGWFPEEDIHELEILEEFIDHVESLPAYMFKLHYTTREQLIGNFGNQGKTMPLPFSTGREYSHDATKHVLSLSDPKADKVERAIYDGSTEDVTWETIL